MQSLNFKTPLKTYAINDDENAVIKINTTDFGLIDRLKNLVERTGKIADKYKAMSEDKLNIDVFIDFDKDIRKEIDYVLGEGVSQSAFGDVNCLSICDDGSMIFENFLNCVVPVILDDVQTAVANRSKHIEKYTNQAKRLTK
uniref:hypothetical protein n=1 Tax=uncultured Ruminococcus sp. TaxID=165186 RepID=UPI0025E9C94D|nr:hypothetical protein [uncultured Ruminococcus sp.]